MTKNKTVTLEEMNTYLQSKTLQHDKCRYIEKLKVLRLRPGAPEIPQYATPGSSGLDLRADFSYTGMDSFDLYPHDRLIVYTGLAIEIPVNYEAQVRSRSGLALKHGIVVLNSPGTIDSDYRGEIQVILYNTTDEFFKISHGDRIAQLVIAPVKQLLVQEVKSLSNTIRGAGGFGHTGVK